MMMTMNDHFRHQAASANNNNSQEQIQYAPRERPPMMEMRQKAGSRESMFSSRSNVRNRPTSVYTEFMESDFEDDHDDEHDDEHDDDDDEVYSEFGDLEGIEEGECSPRASIGGSVGDFEALQFESAPPRCPLTN